MSPEYLGDSNHAGAVWSKTGALAEIKTEHAAVSCVKQGLTDMESPVFRMYEPEGKGGSVQLCCGRANTTVNLEPYQIRTVKLSEEGFTACDHLERGTEA